MISTGEVAATLRAYYCLVTDRVVPAEDFSAIYGYSPSALRKIVAALQIVRTPGEGVRLGGDKSVETILEELRGRVAAARIVDAQATVDEGQLRKAYSRTWGDGKDARVVAAEVGMSEDGLRRTLRERKITRRALPLTDEELEVKSDDEVVSSLVAVRQTRLEAAALRAETEALRVDAHKYRAQVSVVRDIGAQMSTYVPPPQVEKLKLKGPVCVGAPRKLIVNICDWQIGALAQREELIAGGEWSTAVAVAAVKKYVERILEYVAAHKYVYDEVLLLNLGDLGHGLHGETASGTLLEVDSLRGRQVKAIMDCMLTLVESLRRIVPKVSVYSVEDNHMGFAGEMLMDQLAYWYGGANPVSDVQVHRNSKPVEYIPIGDSTLLVMYHGATGRPGKGDLDKGKGRERNAYYLIQEGVRRYPSLRDVHIVTGHVHHLKTEEFAHFTIHTLGSMCGGDFYADSLLLAGRPSQTIMEVNPENGMLYAVPIPLDMSGT